MKKFRTVYLLILVLLAGITMPSRAADSDFPVPVQPSSWTNDYARIFTDSQAKQLDSKLAALENRSSTQIFIVTLTDSKGYEPSDLAQQIGEKWHVGQQKKDNGIVILVDVTAHKTFIATGYGVEEYVPDAIAKRIVENEMIPRFKQNDYFGGVNAAVDVLISILDGKFTAEQYLQKHPEGKGSSIGGIIFMIILLSLLFGGRNNRSSGMGRRSNLPFWIALGLLNSGRGSSGSWGGFSGGGGGFGGGGGGSFGGGGAGGSW